MTEPRETFTAVLPTGTQLELPVGADDAAIRRTLKYHYGKDLLEQQFRLPPERAEEILAPFKQHKVPVPIAEIKERYSITFREQEPIDPMFAPEVPRTAQRTNLIDEYVLATREDSISPGTQIGRIFASSVAADYGAAVSRGLDAVLGFLPAGGISLEELLGHLPEDSKMQALAAPQATLRSFSENMRGWAEDEIQRATSTEAFAGGVLGIFAAAPLFRIGGTAASMTLQNGAVGALRLAHYVGAEKAAANLYRFITRPGIVARTIQRGVSGAGGFAGYAMLSHDPEDAGKEAIIGAVTAGAGAIGGALKIRAPTKFGNIESTPLRIAAEAIALSTSSSIVHDTPLTTDEVLHSLIFLGALGALNKSAEFSRQTVNRWMHHATEVGGDPRQGWMTREKAQALKQYLQREMGEKEFAELRGKLRTYKSAFTDAQRMEIFQKMFQKMNWGQELTYEEHMMARAYGVTALMPEGEGFFTMPRTGAVEGEPNARKALIKEMQRRGAPMEEINTELTRNGYLPIRQPDTVPVQGSPIYMRDFAQGQIRESLVLPKFLEHVPVQTHLEWKRDVLPALKRAAEEAGADAPFNELRWVKRLWDDMRLMDEVGVAPNGDLRVPYADFVRGVLRNTTVLRPSYLTHLADYRLDAVFPPGVRERFNVETERGRSKGTLVWSSPVSHGMNSRNYYGGERPEHGIYDNGRYLFHTRYAFDPQTREYYLTEVQNDFAQIVSHAFKQKGIAEATDKFVRTHRAEYMEMRELSRQWDTTLARLEKTTAQLLRAHEERAGLDTRDFNYQEKYDKLLEEISERDRMRNRLKQTLKELKTGIDALRPIFAQQASAAPEGSPFRPPSDVSNIIAAWEGLGVRDPGKQFYRRALEESVRDAARVLGGDAGKLMIPHENTAALLQGWYGRLRESDVERIRKGEDVRDLIRHFEGHDLRPLYDFYREMREWASENFADRGTWDPALKKHRVRQVDRFGTPWVALRIDQVDRQPERLTVPLRERGALDVDPVLQRGADLTAKWTRKFLDATLGLGAGGGGRGGRGRRFEPSEDFDREEFVKDIKGFHQFQMRFYTLLQNRDFYARQSPELENYVRTFQGSIDSEGRIRGWSPDMNRWLTRAQETRNLLRRLPKAERNKLSDMMFDEVLDSRQTGTFFTDAKRGEYGLLDSTMAIYRRIQQDYRDFFKEMRDAIIDAGRRRGIPDFESWEARTRETFDELLRRPYINFARFGKYYVVIRDAETKQSLEMFAAENLLEKRELQKKLNRRFQGRNDVEIITGKFDRGSMQSMTGMPPGVIQRMRELMEVDSPELRKENFEKLVRQIIPSGNWPRHLLKRRMIPGFSRDIERVYADYFFHGVNHLMRLRYRDELHGHIEAIRKRRRGAVERNEQGTKMVDVTGLDNMERYLTDHFNYIMNPKWEGPGLRGFFFDWFLGYNVSSAVVNLTQVPLATYPYLAARYGDAQAARGIGRAYKDITAYLTKGRGLTVEEEQVMTQARKLGITDESGATEIAGTSEGRRFGRGAPTGPKEVINLVHTWAPWMFQVSEQYNRRVTFLSAYRLAREKGVSKPSAFKEARRAVDWTQGEYQRWNRPWFMRNWRAPLFLFQQYPQHMLVLAAKDPGAGRFLAMVGAASGLMGLPFAEDLADAIDFAVNLGKGGKRWDARLEIAKLMEAVDLNPRLALHGLGGTELPFVGESIFGPSLDISTRLSLGRLLPGAEAIRHATSGEEGAGVAAGGELLREGLGAIMSPPVAWLQAMGSDSPYALKTWEKAMPSALRGLTRGGRYLIEGREFSDRSGATIHEWEEGYDRYMAAVKTALGFGLVDVNEYYEGRRHLREHELFYAARANEFARRAYRALLDDDTPTFRGILADEIPTYNKMVREAGLPEMQISGQRLERSIKQKLKNKLLEERRIGRTTQERAILRDLEPIWGPQGIENIEDSNRP